MPESQVSNSRAASDPGRPQLLTGRLSGPEEGRRCYKGSLDDWEEGGHGTTPLAGRTPFNDFYNTGENTLFLSRSIVEKFTSISQIILYTSPSSNRKRCFRLIPICTCIAGRIIKSLCVHHLSSQEPRQRKRTLFAVVKLNLRVAGL